MESSGDSDVVFNFYCTAGKLNRCQNFRGLVTLSLDSSFCESVVVDCNPVVCCSFHWVFETQGAFGRWFCAGLVFSGLFAWGRLMNDLDAEYRWAFLHPRWLRGMLADKTLDSLAR